MTHTHTKTSTYTEGILQEINDERRRQVVELGYDAEHDDQYGPNQLSEVGDRLLVYGLQNNNREHLIKGLAVQVAAAEAFDRRAAGTNAPVKPPEQGVDLGRTDPVTNAAVGYCPNCAHAMQLHRHRDNPVLGACTAYGCVCQSPLT